MTHVTINGPVGSGVSALGIDVAKLMEANYVDRIVLAEAAKLVGSTVEILDIKAHRLISFKDRLSYFLQTMLERSAMSGASGEPYFSPGVEHLPSEEYGSLIREPITAAQQMDDFRFMEALRSVIIDFTVNSGDSVIVGRGSNIILQDHPDVIHVCVNAPYAMRLETISRDQNMDSRSAGKYIADMEEARVQFYKKFFSVDPNDSTLYHLVFNLGKMSVGNVARIITQTASCHT